MASIPSKRARTTDSSNDFLPTSSRVKRRTRTSVAHDKNACSEIFDDDPVDPSSNHGCLQSPTQRTAGGSTVGRSPVKPKAHIGAYIELQDENVPQLPTPKTPRHRDALSNKVPVTPRHRIGLAGNTLTPRTPRTPLTASNAPTVYSCARQLFTRSADPGPLVGREAERKELDTFVRKAIHSRSGRCLYVSGPPGTGKSALVKEVCRGVHDAEGVETSYINCMSATYSKDICGKLRRDLLGDNYESESDGIAHLKSIFVPKKKSTSAFYIVALDEIDHLLTLDMEILCTLFEWSLESCSRLVLIGIANALDLTDRLLPRLKARNLKPQLLPFLPYTAAQIASVITSKLNSLCPSDEPSSPVCTPFLHPSAIQLCSKKVASQTGDLRKAFDIVYRTIDLVEIEAKQDRQRESTSPPLQNSPTRNALRENPNLSSPRPHPSLIDLTVLTAPRANIAHVSRVSAAALSNGTSQRLRTLNLQQKAALCALVSHQKSIRKSKSCIFGTPSKAPFAASTMSKLYSTYCILCKRENALHPLTGTEFADVVTGLETLGMVGEESGGRRVGAKVGTPNGKGKGVKEERKFVGLVDEGELRKVLDGLEGGLLRGFLDEQCANV